MMAAFLAAIVCVCLIACSSENEEPEQPQTFLNINIFAPTEKKSSLVRADHGSVQAINNENLIYDVWVWAFLTGDTQGDNAKPVGSLYKKLGGVSSTTCQMGIAPNIIVGNKKLDIYVVTNSEAIPSGAYGMGHNLTLGEVKNLQFGKMTRNATTYDDFGVSAPQNTVQEDKGLPMSQYAIGQDVINASKLSKSVNIKLRRAVSKLRFVFARRTGLPNVQVTGFTLEGSLIPNREYVFPDNTNDRTPHINTSAGYDATALTFTQTLDTDDILQYDNPKSLGWDGSESGEDYTDRLEEAFGTYTSSLYYGLTYLRETGQKLTGTIRYKFSDAADATEYSAPFTMAEAGDFTRNHEYLVYAYFEKSGLQVTVTVSPWELNEVTHQFANTVAIADGGQIKWTVGTYREQTGNLEIIMHPDINIHPEFTFNLGSPKGATWHAMFRTKEGDNTAFSLRDAEGNEHSQGIIDGKPVTLKVHAREASPGQTNSAELVFVVRCNGEILPVDVLTPSGQGNYIIVQEHI